MQASLGALDVSATRQMHSISSIPAIVKPGGHSPSLTEAGQGYPLPGLGDQPFAEVKRNKQNIICVAFYRYTVTKTFSV